MPLDKPIDNCCQRTPLEIEDCAINPSKVASVKVTFAPPKSGFVIVDQVLERVASLREKWSHCPNSLATVEAFHALVTDIPDEWVTLPRHLSATLSRFLEATKEVANG